MNERKLGTKKRILILYCTLFVVIGIGIGYIIGRFTNKSPDNNSISDSEADLKETSKILADEMKEENIKNHLK